MRQRPILDSKGMKLQSVTGPSAIRLVMVLWLCFLATRSVSTARIASASTSKHGTYTTHFPLTENPISEGGNWINGRPAALDWANIRTIPGLAFGTELATVTTAPGKYDDSTALLAGTWGPNQTAQSTVHSVNPSDKFYEEVELRLRSRLSPHSATGYEVNFRCSKTGKGYTEIIRWNGPLGSFTYITRIVGVKYGVADEDVIKATIVGNVITAYIDGVQVLQGTDDTYTSGSPGMGFYMESTTGVNGDYGFSSFMATDD